MDSGLGIIKFVAWQSENFIDIGTSQEDLHQLGDAVQLLEKQDNRSRKKPHKNVEKLARNWLRFSIA
ncbi:hypothetical protein [Algoriphagus winogradskyi]|uniref:Uncharacterized protein n=1 Tax=Algoriphagus winogradskyi TaxID=237017 RepID=A0ABY1PJB5_9BACT|nr:hypothetical protein [Algoriphagus winogradskyi]SMP33220.1 hypothetical protein SAMN06265367_108146 [Algoriphagus winogradskyi]